MKSKELTEKPGPPLPFKALGGLRSLDIYILTTLFVLLIYHVYIGWITTKDDAFITFRYAEHLARGHGLVWNVGEAPVEGYTNFLFMILMAFFALFKANLVIVAKIVNLLSAVGIFLMLVWILDRIYKDRFILYFGVFLFVFPYFTSAQVAGGLETMFYAALVTLACFLLLRQMDEYSPKRKIAFSLVLLSMGLARPEGVLVAALLIAVELGLVKKARRKESIKLLALWYVLPAAVYMIARIMYFHYLLPNPFYIKKSSKAMSLIGLIELQEFILKTKMYIGLICVPFLSKKIRKPLLMLMAIFIPSLAVYMFFRPMMNYAFRYYQPYYPIMIPMLAAPLGFLKNLVVRFADSMRMSSAVKQAASVVLLLGSIYFLCPYVFPDFKPNYTEFRYWRRQGRTLNDCHVVIGKLLGRFPEYKDRYIALGDCGAIPYYSKWNVLDMGGLNDVHLAHKGDFVSLGMEAFATKFDLDYVFRKDPAVIVVASSNPVTVDHYASRVFVHDYRFSRYQRIIAFGYLPRIYELVYVKKDDPALKKLIDSLVDYANSRGAQSLKAVD